MRFRKDARLDRSQVEDYRGRRMGGTPMALGGGGIVSIVIVLAVLLLGGNLGGGGGLGGLGDLAGQTAGTGAAPSSNLEHCQTGEDANQYEDCRILAVVNSVQAYWTKAVRNYQPARTRFFTGGVQTACGAASSAVGPFYCPGDKYVYIDLDFFDELESFGGSSGPLSQAYVLAHEYGHHVQDLTGVLDRARGGDTGPQSNGVRVELQADCYAGVWVANALRTGLVEDITRADIQDALTSAAAIGDDRIQEKAQGQVNPETWTHGSSDQRQSWFVRGVEGGTPSSCDTFSGRV
jgi:hypothetical protein